MHRGDSSTASKWSWRQLVFAFMALSLATLALGGCGKPGAKRSRGDSVTTTAATDDTLESANEILYKNTLHSSYQAALQQINAYFNRHEKDKAAPISAEEQARLEAVFAIDGEELAELNTSTYTLLDAYHLETCFLLRDAARSLLVEGRPPLDQAVAAFAWVMRQVRLDEKQKQTVPELFVLRRGRGKDLERARVFLALLEQLGLEGCLLRIPQDPDPAAIVRVIPGVLVDKEIYLFDCKLGLPFPGPSGRGIATLAQLKKDPGLVAQITVDAKHPYDVKPEQIKNADVLWYCSLSALSPRMKVLETILPEQNKVRLSIDYAAVLGRVRAAATAAGTAVHTVDSAGRALPLTRQLRYFLPANDGGIDAAQAYPAQELEGFAPPPVEGQPIPVLRFTQLNFFQLELAPWNQFPDSLRGLPWNTPLGLKLREFFGSIFAEMFVPGEASKNKMQPPHARDLLLRGQSEEAMRALTARRDILEKQNQEARADPTVEQAVIAWCAEMNEAYRRLGLAQFEAQQNKEKGGEALAAARQRVEELEKLGEKRLPLVLIKAIAQPLEGEIAYVQALCKHEQAERLEAALKRPGASPGPAEIQAARAAWESAAGWWVTFESAHDASPAIVHARGLHARACEALGQSSTAITLLENFAGPVSEAERVARLYRIAQLKR